MGLRIDPVGGGQFKQAIKQILEAEAQPIKQLEGRKAIEDAKMKLLQEFKSRFAGIDKALNDISSFQKFRELKVDLGDGANSISVTIDKDKAQPGTYQIQVDQLAARTSIISNGFEDPDEPILGIGFINLVMPDGETAEIFVDDDESSLRGVASLINKQANSPVRAAVINDASDEDAPWKLIITAKKDGLKNSITFPEFYFLDGSSDFYVDDSHEAQNARVQVDGFPIELASNDMPDFFPGVNLHLKQARPEQPFTLMISEDFQKVSGKVKGLVEELNKVLEFIYKQNAVDEKSDTRATFAGDSSLQLIEYKIRNLMHEGYPVGDPDDDFRLIHLNDLGVEFGKNGLLSLREDKFQKTLEKDFAGVTEAITGEFGFATQLRIAVAAITRPGNGAIANKEQGLRSRIRDIDNQIDMKMRALDRRKQALTEQFSRLEASLGAMQRQSQYLSAALPGAGGGGNLVQQLLGG